MAKPPQCGARAEEYSHLLKASQVLTKRHWRCLLCLNYFTTYRHERCTCDGKAPDSCPYCGVSFVGHDELA